MSLLLFVDSHMGYRPRSVSEYISMGRGTQFSDFDASNRHETVNDIVRRLLKIASPQLPDRLTIIVS